MANELISFTISCIFLRNQSSCGECAWIIFTSRDANISTHRVILWGLNAVTGFPQRVRAKTRRHLHFSWGSLSARKSPSRLKRWEREGEGKGLCILDEECREKERVKEKEMLNSWSLMPTTVRTFIFPWQYVDCTGKSFSSELFQLRSKCLYFSVKNR